MVRNGFAISFGSGRHEAQRKWKEKPGLRRKEPSFHSVSLSAVHSHERGKNQIMRRRLRRRSVCHSAQGTMETCDYVFLTVVVQDCRPHPRFRDIAFEPA